MPLETRSPALLRFGTFEVDLCAGELRKQGVRIKLQEQPFHVLTALLLHPGKVVTREDLRAQLWSADTFVDFDNSLNTSINKLRETLADSAESPRFVETLPRRGYRFIAPVERDDRDRPGLGGPPAPDHHASLMGKQAPRAIVKTPPAGARRWRHGLVAAGAIALVLLTIAAWQRRAPAETPAGPLSLIALTTL